MAFAFQRLVTLVGLLFAIARANPVINLQTREPSNQQHHDPCAFLAGAKWVAPKDLRACYESFPVDEAVKANILDVVAKTLAFHTSVNYQIQAPSPYSFDVHEDVLADLARIGRTRYHSEYAFHIDLSRSVKRLNDGHCAWVSACYDSMFVNYLPTPLVLLSDSRGRQSVHIAPVASKVASAEFPDQIDVWQKALQGKLKDNLQALDGAKVLLIDGKLPFDAVHANSLIAGSYQAYGTRQNGFFSSYQRTAAGWNYILGNFAQQALPLSDHVTLTIQRVNATLPETITLPYRSRIGASSTPFNNVTEWRNGNCNPKPNTNGVDLYASAGFVPPGPTEVIYPVENFQQQGLIYDPKSRLQPMNVILDDLPLQNVGLPAELQPSLTPVDGSRSVAQFYLLEDGKTGVLALGSFSDNIYGEFLAALLKGLQSLKNQGATQLIVDVTNNGGGYICAAHWLHRIIAGPKNSTVPQAGLYTKTRAGPLAKEIVKNIIENNGDPEIQMSYNPLQWRSENNEIFSADANWLEPTVEIRVNGRDDAFSPRLGQECQPEGFPLSPPEEPLFDTQKVVIVSNGRCASSCSLFSITMSKHEKSKTVVVGGASDVKQQYCGIVGGQSTDFTTIDTEVKTAHLKDHPLAPPDLLINGVQGITWRLAFGIDNRKEPEEWQNHPADLNLPLTAKLANNPVAIWKEVTRRLLA